MRLPQWCRFSLKPQLHDSAALTSTYKTEKLEKGLWGAGHWVGGPGATEVGVSYPGSMGHTEWERGSSLEQWGLYAGVGTAFNPHRSHPELGTLILILEMRKWKCREVESLRVTAQK